MLHLKYVVALMSMSAFFIPQATYAGHRLSELGSLGAACYILYEHAGLVGEFCNDVCNRPTNWYQFCKKGFGTGGNHPWIPASILALYTLHELAARYCFTKKSFIGTLDKKRKKHKTLYNSSKIAMALPIITCWAKVLSNTNHPLDHAKNHPIAPLSLFLAGSHCVPALTYLFPHLFLH